LAPELRRAAEMAEAVFLLGSRGARGGWGDCCCCLGPVGGSVLVGGGDAGGAGSVAGAAGSWGGVSGMEAAAMVVLALAG
jgi:hypothetical protein